MEISPLLQARLLLCSALLGVVASVSWDIVAAALGLMQKKGCKTKFIRFAFDYLFVSLCGAAILVLCYYFNKGVFRFFTVLGFLAAFFVFRALFGRLVQRIFCFFAHFVFNVIRVILTPFVKVFKLLVNILKKSIYYINESLEKITVLVYNINVKRAILKRSKKGLL